MIKRIVLTVLAVIGLSAFSTGCIEAPCVHGGVHGENICGPFGYF